MKETVRNSWMTYPLLNTRDCSEFTGLLKIDGGSYDRKITSYTSNLSNDTCGSTYLDKRPSE